MNRGQLAYETYRNFSEGKSLVTGAPLPEWHSLAQPIQMAWCAAATAVELDYIQASICGDKEETPTACRTAGVPQDA